MLPPVVQIDTQHWGLHAQHTSTTAGVTSSGRYRLSWEMLFKIPPSASTLIYKFPPSLPPISIWPHQAQQKPIYSVPPPRRCTTIELWQPLLSPLRPPGLAQTVIYKFQERSHVWALVTNCGQWRVWYGCLHLLCWSSQHAINGGFWGTPPRIFWHHRQFQDIDHHRLGSTWFNPSLLGRASGSTPLCSG